jgi:hypothetical protein
MIEIWIEQHGTEYLQHQTTGKHSIQHQRGIRIKLTSANHQAWKVDEEKKKIQMLITAQDRLERKKESKNKKTS